MELCHLDLDLGEFFFENENAFYSYSTPWISTTLSGIDKDQYPYNSMMSNWTFAIWIWIWTPYPSKHKNRFFSLNSTWTSTKPSGIIKGLFPHKVTLRNWTFAIWIWIWEHIHLDKKICFSLLLINFYDIFRAYIESKYS